MADAETSESELYRLGVPCGEGVYRRYDYGNRYAVECVRGVNRLVIGPSGSGIDAMLGLASAAADQAWWITYVLLLSRDDCHEPGRYDSPLLASLDDAKRFLAQYRDLLDRDGRHHVWLRASDSGALIVNDHHGVLFAYGLIEPWEFWLDRNGYERREDLLFPDYHSHHYHEEFDAEEARILQSLPWTRSDLAPQDTYD